MVFRASVGGHKTTFQVGGEAGGSAGSFHFLSGRLVTRLPARWHRAEVQGAKVVETAPSSLLPPQVSE